MQKGQMMYQKLIEEYIESHKAEMVEDIFTLCRINSEKMPALVGKPYGEGTVKALSAALVMAEKYGFKTTNYDNYVGTADMNDKENQLDILAHLDVVPAGEGWEVTSPFDPVERDGKLYGRGTADDKGPAVAALYAMRAVKELGIPLTKNVRLILGTDEECGSSDIVYYYSKEQEAPMTFTPDASFPVINVEKGRFGGHFTAVFEESEQLPRVVEIQAGIKLNVVPGKASAVFQGVPKAQLKQTADQLQQEIGIAFDWQVQGDLQYVTAIGAGAHAAYPTDGNNALTGLLTLIKRLPFAACEQIDRLHQLESLIPHGDLYGKALGIAMEDQLSGPLTLAFSMLQVDGKQIDGMFDSRCPVCATEDNVLAVAKDRMFQSGFTLHTDSMIPSHYVDGNSHFVKTLLKAYEQYTGEKGQCQSTGGGTYVHNLKNGVAFGAAMPNTDNHMHGADEFAVLEELIVSAKIFAQVIVDLCI